MDFSKLLRNKIMGTFVHVPPRQSRRQPKILIISPKFEISGMLWLWSGRRRIRRIRRRPHAKACVSRNCDTNARIKFIFDTAIDTLEWKNPIDFGDYVSFYTTNRQLSPVLNVARY